MFFFFFFKIDNKNYYIMCIGRLKHCKSHDEVQIHLFMASYFYRILHYLSKNLKPNKEKCNQKMAYDSFTLFFRLYRKITGTYEMYKIK
jgi:hypothetical protein